MAFDFKKEYKEYYLPKNKPEIVDIPKMNYISVQGIGDPNEKEGSYSKAISVLYALAYTLKMSYKSDYKIKGFLEYVVPPLEGFWWQDNVKGIDYSKKYTFNWISVIRIPDFIRKEDFTWAIDEVTKKKKIDCSKAKFITVGEGLCVQMMHIGPYDLEPATIRKMNEHILEHGYETDINEIRLHHEIYISDPRKTDASKLKTVIRHPIKKII